MSTDLQHLEAQIAAAEAQAGAVRPDNEARIVWADPARKTKTAYSVVYLHGLGGSQGDGMPIHTEFARRYGCNLYLSRLYGHGLESPDALADITPDKYFDSAVRAYAIGKQLGRKVILMATSTGATLALMIASQHPDEIAGLILYSPNIDFRSKAVTVLVMPWGLHVGRMITRGKYVVSNDPDSVRKYWYSNVRLECVASAKSLIDRAMNAATFSAIRQPCFVGYYYKDDAHQDTQVSVPRILEMFDQLGTPAGAKRKIAFPDAGVHPIASSLMSHDLDSVRRETFKFAEEVLKLHPVNDQPSKASAAGPGNRN